MNNNGFNIQELYNACNKDVVAFSEQLIISPKDSQEICIDLKHFQQKKNFKTTKSQGDFLEAVVKKILDANALFHFGQNLRTSTNEIDFLVELNSAGKKAKAEGYVAIDDSFLIECKNYPSSKVNVTSVGKFAALLMIHRKKLGILISPNGITARSSWSDSLGFTKKLYLKEEILLISITVKDLLEIAQNKKTFFQTIIEKSRMIIEDCDLKMPTI